MYEEWKTRSLENNFKKQDIFTILMISIVFIFLRRVIIKSIAETLNTQYVDDSQISSKEKVKLFGSVYRFYVYSVFSLYGIFTLFFEDWILNTFQYTLTWVNNDIPQSIRFYYMIEISHYLTSTFFLISEPRMADFKQMILHHVVTLILMSISYYLNLLRYGTFIMLLHDLSDPFMELAKIFFYLKHQKLADLTFLGFAFIFIITRCLIFPMFIIAPIIYYNNRCFYIFGAKTAIICLITLLILNLIWAFLIVKMAIGFLKKGKVSGDIRTDESSKIK